MKISVCLLFLAIAVGCASPKVDAPKDEPVKPTEPATSSKDEGASQAAQEAYQAMLAKPSADAFVATLTCFQGGMKVAASAVLDAMAKEEVTLRSASLQVLTATPQRVELVDRGLHTSPERAMLYERAVVLQNEQGAWKIVSINPLAAAGCEGDAFKSVETPAAFSTCQAQNTCASKCKEMCQGPTGSNGCMTCVDACGQALAACLKL